MKQLHQDGSHHKHATENRQNVRIDVSLHVSVHKRKVFQTLEKHEGKKNGCDGHTAEDTNLPADVLREVEGEREYGSDICTSEPNIKAIGTP